MSIMYIIAMQDARVTETWPPLLRSALFVPAHRADFVRKAMHSAADALILDLEDSVTASKRDDARRQVRAAAATERSSGPWLCVRINAVAGRALDEDLAVAVGPGLLAVVVPKVRGAEDVEVVEAALAARERLAGLPAGRIRIWPLVESAAAVQASAQLAASTTRIAYLGGGTSRGGDLAASLGFEWTAGGLETLFVRSKILVDARAAGVPHPVTGLVTDLHDVAQLLAFAAQSRQLGYEGMMVIHPSHVAPVNDIFGASAAHREQASALLAALERGEASGHGAVTHEGRMIDTAMRAPAQDLLRTRPPGASRSQA